MFDWTATPEGWIALATLDFHVPKGYVYFAMAFSVAVEMVNIRMRKRSAKPVRLSKHMRAADAPLKE